MSPFNIIYGGIDGFMPEGSFDKLNLPYKELSSLAKNNRMYQSFFLLASSIEDVDDDNFKFVDAYGKTYSTVSGYLDENNKAILLPDDNTNSFAKNDYPTLYARKGTLVYVNIHHDRLKMLNIFKKEKDYLTFNRVMIDRYEYFLNILEGMTQSTLDGQVKEVNDDNIKVEDTTIPINNKDYAVVEVDDVVKSGQLLEKIVEIKFNTSVYYDIKGNLTKAKPFLNFLDEKLIKEK